MAKIKLGARPESVKYAVKFKLLDGQEAQIQCVYKYRTRTEFAEYVKSMTGKKDDGEFDYAAFIKGNVQQAADYLKGVLLGWDLDADLSEESLFQLADELPQACAAIMEAYRAAMLEGRLGN
jgi:hypothetical protein